MNTFRPGDLVSYAPDTTRRYLGLVVGRLARLDHLPTLMLVRFADNDGGGYLPPIPCPPRALTKVSR